MEKIAAMSTMNMDAKRARLFYLEQKVNILCGCNYVKTDSPVCRLFVSNCRQNYKCNNVKVSCSNIVKLV